MGRNRDRAATAQAAEVLESESTATETVAPTSADIAEVASVTDNPPKSIRSYIRTNLLAGTPTKVIGEGLARFFPDSAAARKSVKHIAFYRAQMRKAGELPARSAS